MDVSKPLDEQKKDSFRLFNAIAPTYDKLNLILSLGIDKKWRKKFHSFLPKRANLKCLDLATGTADVAIELAKNNQIYHISAIDLSEGMLAIGKQKVIDHKLENKINISLGDGVLIPFPENSIDVITVAFGIRNFYDIKLSMQNMYRVLNPGGRTLIMEFSLPQNFIVKSLYLFYFRNFLPFIGKLVSGHSSAYTYLNKSVEEFPYGEQFQQLLKDAGFKTVGRLDLSFGIASLYWAEK